jgi:hypothetical protein
MIKDITPSGRYIQVSGGSASNYINGYSGLQGVGNLRFNTTTQCMEVYDGTSWITLNMGYASVGLTPDAESLLDWARQKRNEELLLKDRMEKHPGLKEAYERLEIMKILTHEEETKEQK